jgi:hypothetical protein
LALALTLSGLRCTPSFSGLSRSCSTAASHPPPLSLWGTVNYARLTALLTAPLTVAGALVG